MSLLWWIVIACVVAALGFAFAAYYPEEGLSADRETKESDPVNANRYGHGITPVGEIRRQLPKLGDRHLWESWVDSSSGEPIFVLNLLETSVAGERVVAQRKLNMARDGKPWSHYPTWTATYAGFPYNMNKEARAGLVSPTVEWARAQTNLLYGTREGHEVRR